MIKNTSRLMVLVLVSFSSLACINEYHTSLSGELIEYSGGDGLPQYKHLKTSKLEKELARLDKLFKKDHSLETLSDYGVTLIYLGRYDEAIRLYRGIEAQKAGLYATAANLGTAYELNGNVDSAYFFIEKAIAINPSSHHGSEWIHLKILAAKKELKSDPHYLQKGSILGVNFGNDAKPANPDKVDLKNLLEKLYYQLGERMTFVKPQDHIVGQLLFDLGNMEAQVLDVESALKCYALAREYGYSSSLLAKRTFVLKSMTLDAKVETGIGMNVFISLNILFMAGCFGLWVLVRIIIWIFHLRTSR